MVCALEIFGDRWIAIVFKEFRSGIDTGAAEENDVEIAVAIFDVHCPCGATGRMAWSQMSGKCVLAKMDGRGVFDDQVGFDRFELHEAAVAKKKIEFATGAEQFRIGLRDDYFCAGDSLHGGVAGDVVCMGVTGEDVFDVARSKAELEDIALDNRNAVREAGIDQDVPLGTGDEKRTDVAHADKIDIADDAKGNDGFVPAIERFLEGGVVIEIELRGGSCQNGEQERREKERAHGREIIGL